METKTVSIAQPQEIEPVYIDLVGASRLTGLKTTYLTRLRYLGKLQDGVHYRKLGHRLVIFHRAKLIEWIESH